MAAIDLNCDMGEGFGAYAIGDDAAMLRIVTSANIACGFHAGDPNVIDATLRLAKENGVAPGAHPGFLDLYGFGRRAIRGESPADIERQVIYQVGAVQAMAHAAGHPIRHVKAHGALANMAAEETDLAIAVARGVKAVDPSLILVVMPGMETAKAAERLGLRMACEIYADRAYADSGNLLPRKQPGAVIHDADEAARRVVQMVEEGAVVTASGKRIWGRIDTVCVHGDTPGAVRDGAARAGAAYRGRASAGADVRGDRRLRQEEQGRRPRATGGSRRNAGTWRRGSARARRASTSSRLRRSRTRARSTSPAPTASIEFYIETGVDGITILGVLGEAPKLTPQESRAFLEHVLRRIDGRIPVVVGASNPGTDNLVRFSKEAMGLGAAGLMIAPIQGLRTDDQIYAYWEELFTRLGPDVPVVYQDFPQTTKVVTSVSVLHRLIDAFPGFVMLKHEEAPGLAKITKMRERSDKGQGRRVSILVGNGALHLPQELRRGVDGAMTGFGYPEMLVQVCDLFAKGQPEAGEDLFDIYLPIVRHEQQLGFGLGCPQGDPAPARRHRQRGDPASGPEADRPDHQELDELMARLERRLAEASRR